ncbi:MAG: hypothetical protein Fur0043_24650 [Anaerolineales bacterium]
MSIQYHLPLSLVVSLMRDALLARKRNFRKDSLTCVKELHPPLLVLSAQHIPTGGPCVVTVNHYSRPGFGAWWLALSIAALVPVDMHWVMTGELLYLGRLGSPISRCVLQRIGRVYDFTVMPPMPPRPQDIEARARAVQTVIKRMQQNGNEVLGLAPEGSDQPKGKLAYPPPGVGRFGLLLAGLGCKFVPVGAYETETAFCLRFGPAYSLQVSPGLSASERDRLAANIIMQHIAALLPEHLRGEFA